MPCLEFREGSNQLWSKLVQLTGMIERESLQQVLPLTRDFEDYAPCVGIDVLARKEPSLLTALAEFHHAIVPKAQAVGCIADRRCDSVWRAGDL